MAFPSKASTNLTRALTVLAPGKSEKPRILHFVLSRVDGAAGTPRLAFFPKASEATEQKLKEVWKGDATTDNADSLYTIRGAVKIGPSGVSVVPASRNNKVMSPGGMRDALRVAKKQLAGGGVNVAALQHLVDAPIERAADTAQLRGDVWDQDDVPDDEPLSKSRRDDLKLEEEARVKVEAAKKLRTDWNTLHDDIAQALDLGEKANDDNRELALMTLTNVAGRAVEMRNRLSSLLDDLRDSILGTTRFSDSIQMLEEVDARLYARIGEIDDAATALGKKRPMTLAEQKMVPSANDLSKIEAKQDEVHIKRRRPAPKKALPERDPDDHPAAQDKEVDALLREWKSLRAEIAKKRDDPEWVDAMMVLKELQESGNEHDAKTAEGFVNHLSKQIETLDEKVGRIAMRANHLVQTRTDLLQGDANLAALLDVGDYCDEAHAELDHLQRQMGVVRLTPTQAWAIVAAEMKGEDEKDRHYAAAVQRWSELTAKWNVGYVEDDLDTVMDYIRQGGALKVATQYRLEKPISVNDGGNQANAPKDVPLAKLIMQSGFRNLWETGVSQASANLSQRGGIEERMGYGPALRRVDGKMQDDAMNAQLGNNKFDPQKPEVMPRYAGLVSQAQSKGVGVRYGNSFVVWKDVVKKRMTHTPGDSWNMIGKGVINFTSSRHPEPVLALADEINIRLIAAAATGKDGEFIAAFKGDGGGAYIETQLHGDLSWEDVEAIVIDKAAVNQNIQTGNWDGQEMFEDADEMAEAIRKFGADNQFDFQVKLQ